MRARFPIVLAAIGALVALPVHGQERGTASDTITRVLDRGARIAIINSVLNDRLRLFHQPTVIERCYLGRVVGPGGGSLAGLPPSILNSVVGSIRSVCEAQPSDPLRGDTVSIAFKQISHEAQEYIPLDRLNPRLSGLITLRLDVLNGSAQSHIEDWIMRKAADGVWAVMTVRMFGFVVY
jgi:hypothetical protein